MTPADLNAVVALQERCYGVLHWESREAFAAKLAATAGLDCCWVARGDEDIVAYAVSLPVSEATMPALNAATCERAAVPTWLYLHDMAVAPAARGGGLAARLLAGLRSRAQALGLEAVVLVAVQGSVPYWQRQGFVPLVPLPARLVAKQASYGAEACFMVQRLDSLSGASISTPR